MDDNLSTLEIQDEASAKPGKKAAKPSTRKRIERDYFALLADRVTKKEWLAIIAKAIEQAKEGDYRARNLLFEKLLPKDMTLVELFADERPTSQVIKDFVPHLVKKR